MTETLGTLASELSNDWRLLCQRWQSTTDVWDDPVRWQFEREFWQSLEVEVKATQREMEQLSHVILETQRNVH